MQDIRFYKVSKEQFEQDADERLCTYAFGNMCHWDYKAVELPRRSTAGSAGYDFRSPVTFILYPHEHLIIPSGICCQMPKGIFLSIVPRSSIGIKYGITLLNTVGIIDADYYNNPDNGGHIMLGFKNMGEKPWRVEIGDRVCQGIFLPYVTTEDDTTESSRNGGIGSTGV